MRSNKIYQIGVYEFKSSEYENLLDRDNDLDISLLEGPLLYSFVDKAYLEKCMANEILLSDEDSGDDTSEEKEEEKEEGQKKKRKKKRKKKKRKVPQLN